MTRASGRGRKKKISNIVHENIEGYAQKPPVHRSTRGKKKKNAHIVIDAKRRTKKYPDCCSVEKLRRAISTTNTEGEEGNDCAPMPPG